MTGFLQIFVIAVSLAMDALSVSIAGGVQTKRATVQNALKVACFFGAFQALMPVFGWAIGDVMKEYVAAIDHWIAFFLLGFIGVHMIKESVSSEDEKEKKDILQINTLVLLAIATSIDALIVGITLSVLEIPFIVSIFTIGVVTFVLCFFGYLFGSKLGEVFGKRIEILGGVALIAIGTKILIEHLYF
jgi:manganese efflux pump family protein